MDKEMLEQRVNELKIQVEKATHEFCALQGRLAEAGQLLNIFEDAKKQSHAEGDKKMHDSPLD